MSTWDDRLEDGEEFVISVGEELYISCCDCGLVHKIITARNVKTDEIALVFYRNERSTAQLRRRGFGGLQNDENEKWRLVRK